MPDRIKAISGGVLDKYINLLVVFGAESSADPQYTPNTWWLTVVNVNVDGNGGPPWQGSGELSLAARLGTG